MKLNTRILGAVLVWVGVASCWGKAVAVDAAFARQVEWQTHQPEYQEAAHQLGFGKLNDDAFSKLAPEIAVRIRRKAKSLQRAASQKQINDNASDRYQARKQNIPVALAAAQRLQEEGRQKLAKAGVLQEADPQKKVLRAQGEQLLAQGDDLHATATEMWESQKKQQSMEELIRFLQQHPPLLGWDADTRNDEIIGPIIKVPGGVLINGRVYPLQ
jgi:hypothetical protein